MLDVDNCGNWVQKRNLKLENFLRKNSTGFPRYYETCVIDLKGSLLLRNIVITERSVLFTEIIPKSILLSINFSDIKHISLVADRKTLVKGGNNNCFICQHIRILYDGKRKMFSAFPSETKTSSKSMALNELKGISLEDKIEKSRNVSRSSNITNNSTTTTESTNGSGSDETITEDSSAPNSRQSSSLDSAYIPLSIYQAYEPIINYPPPPPAHHSSSSSAPRRHHRTSSSSSSSTSNGSKSSVDEINSITTTPIPGDSRRNSPLENENKRRSRSRKPSPVTKSSSSSSTSMTKRARSVDISQLNHLRKKMFHKMFGTKEAINGGDGVGGSSLQLNQQNQLPKNEKVEPHEEEFLVLNFYLYQPHSGILNELFLFWSRHSVNCTMQMDQLAEFSVGGDDGGINSKSWTSLRAAEKVYMKFAHVWAINSFDNKLDYNYVLSQLTSLHRAINKYIHLKRICWKNWNMILKLLGIMRRCTCPSIGEKVDEEEEELFIERVSVQTVIMDIFRLLYSVCGTSWFLTSSSSWEDNNNYQMNNNTNPYNDMERNEDWPSLSNTSTKSPLDLPKLTNQLVRVLLQCESSWKSTTFHVIFNPQKFAQGQWICSKDSKLIKAITMGHNSSVSLLYEILCIVHFSSKDNGRAKFMSYLDSCPMENFIKLSLTQVINLLWSNEKEMNASQTVLLYRHLFVIGLLLEISPHLMNTLRDTFTEEFRYFIKEESAMKKIPNEYPLKEKLLRMVEELRTQIIGRY